MPDADGRIDAVALELDADVSRQILARAAAGDADAFAAIYHHHSGMVYGICARFAGGDPARAGEMTQDVFVHLWHKLHQYTGDGPFAAWVRRLAINQALNALRTEQRRSNHETSYAELPEPDIVSTRSNGEDRMDIESAVSALPGGARTVFLLHDVHGYSDQEIASMTDTTRGTVRSQLHRARKLLRKALAL
jgi:RNA polymerase sigma-70 factor (ECF subfamily)